MSLIEFKPVTPTRRHTKLLRFAINDFLPEVSKSEKADLLKDRDHAMTKTKNLSDNVKYSAGRNSRGLVTMRHKGGRVKRQYRTIDFKREKKNIPATVMNVEYDPNRTSYIALLKYADGEYSYIIAPTNIKLGDKVISSDTLQDLSVGNAYPVGVIPAATFVHNVELVPGKGGILARGAGSSVQIQGKAAKGYVQVKLPSGEIRLVKETCYATIGTVSNETHSNEKIGKAGRKRHMGVRPTVRGVAQSYKHPHGGGQGKSGRHGTGGPSKDPWGNKRGVITRKNKSTNKYIIKRRTSTLRPKNKPYKTIA